MEEGEAALSDGSNVRVFGSVGGGSNGDMEDDRILSKLVKVGNGLKEDGGVCCDGDSVAIADWLEDR